MPKFIKIKPYKKNEVEINPDQIKELKETKLGGLIADFGTDPRGPEVNHKGVPGTKITMADGTSYKTEESIASLKKKIEAA